MAYPRYVTGFRDSLLAQTIDHLELDLARAPIVGHRGILTTSVIQYNRQPFNQLGRLHEFTFYPRPNERVEISLQLYLTNWGHWRLFAFCRAGMLLSVNLTLLSRSKSVLALSQRIALATRGLTVEQRHQRAVALCDCLTHLGLEVDDSRRLIFGTFDVAAREFVDTSAKVFLRDFVLGALLKGHFMGNKGYELPRLPKMSEQLLVMRRSATAKRAIPLWLRYKVLENAGSRCVNCGHGPSSGRRLHVDHIVPFSQGGRTEFGNLQVLCHLCNLGKGNRSLRRL